MPRSPTSSVSPFLLLGLENCLSYAADVSTNHEKYSLQKRCYTRLTFERNLNCSKAAKFIIRDTLLWSVRMQAQQL